MQGIVYCPPLHPGVVAIEKGAFRSPSTKVANFSSIFTESNDSKYYYVLPIIQFRHTVKEFQVLLFNIYNSIQYYSIVYTQLNGSKYCYVSQVIWYHISD